MATRESKSQLEVRHNHFALGKTFGEGLKTYVDASQSRNLAKAIVLAEVMATLEGDEIVITVFEGASQALTCETPKSQLVAEVKSELAQLHQAEVARTELEGVIRE